jgi:hypothetical protein
VYDWQSRPRVTGGTGPPSRHARECSRLKLRARRPGLDRMGSNAELVSRSLEPSTGRHPVVACVAAGGPMLPRFAERRSADRGVVFYVLQAKGERMAAHVTSHSFSRYPARLFGGHHGPAPIAKPAGMARRRRSRAMSTPLPEVIARRSSVLGPLRLSRHRTSTCHL